MLEFGFISNHDIVLFSFGIIKENLKIAFNIPISPPSRYIKYKHRSLELFDHFLRNLSKSLISALNPEHNFIFFLVDFYNLAIMFTLLYLG
jgi:hypothetical protein